MIKRNKGIAVLKKKKNKNIHYYNNENKKPHRPSGL